MDPQDPQDRDEPPPSRDDAPAPEPPDRRRRGRGASAPDDKPDAPVPTCFRMAIEIAGDGHELAPELMERLDREDSLAAAMLRHPGSIRKSGVRSTMLLGDYATFWTAASFVYDAMVAGGVPMPDEGLDESAVAREMGRLCAARFLGNPGIVWLATVMARPSVGTEYALEVLVAETVGRHQLAEFERRMGALSARIKAGEPILRTHAEYLTTALDIARTPDGGRSVRNVGAELDEWEQEAAERKVVPMGITILDKMMGGGPARGELVVIGGGTNHGKSYFAEQLLHTHASAGRKMAYISIEDPKDLMTCRQIARHCDPPMAPVIIRGGKKGLESQLYDEAVFREAKKKLAATCNGGMFVVEQKKASVSEVCRLMRRYRYDKGVDAIVVDYLQAVRPDEDRMTNNRVQDTANAVADLKRCATDLGVVLYLLSQYSREQYKEGTEPDIQACKYAGDIENEAEAMILFWRDSSDVLHAKMPKIKWTAQKPKFFVRTHKVSGVFLEWEVDYNQGGQGQGGGSGGGRGGYGGRGNGRQQSGGRAL